MYSQIFSIIRGLINHVKRIYAAIKANDFNYAEIQKCHDGDYLIYLKDFSWLDNLRIMIKSDDDEHSFFDFRKFSIHDVKFNNMVEIDIPNDLNCYSISIQYDLNLLGKFKKKYKQKERIKNIIIGENRAKKLRYKIIEDNH